MGLERELCPMCDHYKLLEHNGLCSHCNRDANIVINRLERAYTDLSNRYESIEKITDQLHVDCKLAIYIISANMCNTPQWREQLAARVCPICEENPLTHDSRYCPFCRAFLKAECMKAINELIPRCTPKAIYKVELLTDQKWRSLA